MYILVAFVPFLSLFCGMGIKLRWKINKSNGSRSAYLDIYINKVRKKEYIGIVIKKNDKSAKNKKFKAEAIRTQRHADLLSDRYGVINDAHTHDLYTFWITYMKGIKNTTLRKYRASFHMFLKFMGHESTKIDKKVKCQIPDVSLDFKSIDSSLIESFKDFLFENLSGESPNNYFKRLCTVLNAAKEKKYIYESPAKGIVAKKGHTELKQILTPEEIKILMNTKMDSVRRAFIFCCFTGLGYAEMKKMKYSNLQNDRLIIARAKNSRPISTKLSSIALKMIGVGDNNEVVFRLPSDTTVNKIIKKWVLSSGIDKHITFYCARHSFAVMNLKAGANLKTIADLLGHKNTTFTNKYLNYLDDVKDNAIDLLDGLF